MTHCSNCNSELKPVFELGYITPGCVQFEDVLPIKMDGGYGMYFDDLLTSVENTEFIFCKICADKLCELFPCFNKIKI